MQNRITPTHFVEFYFIKPNIACDNNIDKINLLNQALEDTKFYFHKTIAIGYIQYTDVPLSERLAKRGIKMINE